MGSHPLNLALRFLLELVTVGAVGIWGWKSADGPLRYLLAIGLPLIFMAMWATFAVPDDPSRSGNAPIPVPGSLHLVLELAILAAGAFALYTVGYERWGIAFAIIVIIHYVVSYDRLLWLLRA